MNSQELKGKVILSKLQEKHNYKCNICNLRQGARGYKDSKQDFVECDDFMIKWAETNNRKVFTIGLTTYDVSPQGQSSNLHDYLLLCQLCKSKLHKQLVKLHTKNLKENLKYDKSKRINSNNILDVSLVVMLRQLFYAIKGIEITNNEAENIINVITKK